MPHLEPFLRNSSSKALPRIQADSLDYCRCPQELPQDFAIVESHQYIRLTDLRARPSRQIVRHGFFYAAGVPLMQ